jgi:FkbM family methyltransferase
MDITTLDTTALQHFHPWAGKVPAGFFAYFLGNLTRADYWAFPEETRRLYDRERFEEFSGPACDDNILDWLILLEALLDARNEFVMVALGAGWGRWLVSAALAAKQRDTMSCRLIGVEAEPTHFRWMLQHFRDNNLDPKDHELIEAAAAEKSGKAWFYFGKPSSWYGQSIIRDRSLDSRKGVAEIQYNSEKAKIVRTMDIAEIVANYDRIDYIHMDIQGAELDVLASDPVVLDNKVKRVLVGTHSSQIEVGLRALFRDLGWCCQYDVPLNGSVSANNTTFSLGDGAQVWINPKL